jgi:uncharacterized protein
MTRFFTSAGRAILLACLTLVSSLLWTPAAAQQLFEIATGAQTGTYFPIARAMAAALSEPGVLSVRAQATSGSIANVNAIASGQMASGFSQADIAAWHYSGTGIVKPQFKLEKLRLIATLYPENVHVVVRKSLGLQSIAQLKGLNVALDEPGSGVLVNARQILRAYGLTERDIKPAYIKGPAAAQRMKEGTLDALFFVGGVPSEFVSELAATTDIALLPIDGAEAQTLRVGDGFFTASSFAAQAYKGTAAVNTLAVGAQWFTTSDANADLIYKLTKNLFSPAVLAQVRASHPNAATITATGAAQGAGMPLHAGAERFYREIGVLK